VWICFDADQFRTIVHDSDHTRSFLLAAKLFPVRCHVERVNDDLAWRWVATHDNNNFQLDLAAEELVEEATESGYGDEHRWRSPQWWWTRIQRSSLRTSEIIIVTKLPLPRHFFAKLTALNVCHVQSVLNFLYIHFQ